MTPPPKSPANGYVTWQKLMALLVSLTLLAVGGMAFATDRHSHDGKYLGRHQFDEFCKRFEDANKHIQEQLTEIKARLPK